MTDTRDGTGQADAASERPIFEALLTPYRSLGRRGFNILMAFVGGVSLVTGIAFVAKGAWPVFGFFGVDVLLIWWAFRASYRSAKARELVTVSRTDLRSARSRRAARFARPITTRSGRGSRSTGTTRSALPG